MFSFFKTKGNQASKVTFSSELHDEKTFYNTFLDDLRHATEEVIIESPYIASFRMRKFYSIFETLKNKGVKIFVITRNPKEHIEPFSIQAENAIDWFERIGIQTFLCKGGHHRKLAIIDRKIVWEGSLNILSQANSREIMRRIPGEHFAKEMFDFLKLERFV